jgi:hypothetical protein
MAPVATNDLPAPNLDIFKAGLSTIRRPKVFEDKYQQRQYLKERLALAFRIFAEYGYDEGVAGHITLRVS